MKTVEEIKERRDKLIKRATQALDKGCYQDYSELITMETTLTWVLEDSEDENTNTL